MAFNTEDQAQRERKIKEHGDQAFDAFTRMPTTRLITSTLPPMENPDALNVLLRAAFDAGHNSGSGSVAMTLIEAMLSKQDKLRLPAP